MITKTELTEHNIELYLALCKLLHKQYLKHQSGTLIWKCKLEDRLILGIGMGGSQIFYELPLSRYDEIDCKEFNNIPHYKGFNSQDILDRLKKL